MNYYWVRIFDYKHDKELNEYSYGENNKGTLLDEYYLTGEELSREECKKQVVEKSKVKRFAKPRKNQEGIYALIMDSEKFYYDRFTIILDTICFNCGKPIKGHNKDFPSFYPINYDDRCYTLQENEITEYDHDTRYFFCSYDCKYETTSKFKGYEGEWQSRSDYKSNGGVFGYIYHIYNRVENKHYIGQTLYMPFFRWQEHAKQNIKGNLCDLVFETICEVRTKDQEYLNNIEAWWVQKYINEYGRDNVMNIAVPRITIAYLVEQHRLMINE